MWNESLSSADEHSVHRHLGLGVAASVRAASKKNWRPRRRNTGDLKRLETSFCNNARRKVET